MLEFFFFWSRSAEARLPSFGHSKAGHQHLPAIHQPCHGMEGGTTIMEQICNSYIRYVRYVNWTGEWKILPFYGKQNCVLFQFGLMKLICKVVATEFPKLDPAIRYYLQPNLRQCRLLESYRKLEEHQLGTWQMEIQHDDDDQSRNRINPTKFNRNLQWISKSFSSLCGCIIIIWCTIPNIGSMAEVLHQSGPAKWSSPAKSLFLSTAPLHLKSFKQNPKKSLKIDPPILLQWHWGFFPKETQPFSLAAM